MNVIETMFFIAAVICIGCCLHNYFWQLRHDKIVSQQRDREASEWAAWLRKFK